MVRSAARSASLADFGEVLLQEVLEDIQVSLDQCDSPQQGATASASQDGIFADAPLTDAANGAGSPQDDIRSGIQRTARDS